MLRDGGWTVKLLILIRKLWTQQPVWTPKQMGCTRETTSKQACLFSSPLSCDYFQMTAWFPAAQCPLFKGFKHSFWPNGSRISQCWNHLSFVSVTWTGPLTGFIGMCIVYGLKAEAGFVQYMGCVLCVLWECTMNSYLKFLLLKFETRSCWSEFVCVCVFICVHDIIVYV